ncbi:MAG: hypothetical protein PHV37_07000 [Candidatus Gastranaerophilales bacterium]|nr:hypothetical protein [Candidatus Gastranaerophilales bacterium]
MLEIILQYVKLLCIQATTVVATSSGNLSGSGMKNIGSEYKLGLEKIFVLNCIKIFIQNKKGRATPLFGFVF